MLTHLRRNWLTWLVFVGLLVMFLHVEQINNLFEVPRLDAPGARNFAIGLIAYVLALSTLYLLAGWWVVPLRRRRLTDDAATEKLTTGSTGRVDRFVRTYNRLLAAVCLGISVVNAALMRLVPGGSYLLDPTIQFSFCLLFGSATIVLFCWHRLSLVAQRLLLRSLIALISLNLLGELIWFLAHESWLFSPRNYSLWAIMHVFFCAFLFARVVDVWQNHSTAPIRGVAILLAIGAAAWSTPTTFQSMASLGDLMNVRERDVDGDSHAKPDAEALLAGRDAWLEYLKQRLENMPADGPVVVVAASGGGSRAALFTSLILEELTEMAIEYAPDRPAFVPAEHIVMISSVSGGTLASACYIDRTYPQRRLVEGARSQLRNSIQAELIPLTKQELSDARGLPFYRRVDPETGETLVDFALEAEQQIDQVADGGPLRLDSAFADDMCTDFMAPLLRGALHPGRDRGESVQKFWESSFSLSRSNLDIWEELVAVEVDDDSAIRPPALLCNACEVERGRRLVIGFPPLPIGFLQLGGSTANTPRAWVDLDPRQERVAKLSLAEAARVSANFPWGFPVVSVALPQFNEDGTQSQPDVHLIDGGVCDNTGIDSLRYVIDALKAWSSIGTEAEELTLEEQSWKRQSSEILAILKQRGVLLLEIDSGAKPERPGLIARWFSGFLEPITAMQNAGYATATAAVETNVAVIEKHLPYPLSEVLRERLHQLGHRGLPTDSIENLSALDIPNVRRMTVTCNHQDNVMTAWALGPADKGQIFARFLIGRARLAYDLEEYLKRYEQTRRALLQIDEHVAMLEQRGDVSGQDVSEVSELLNSLAAESQIAQNAHDLRISSEKMYYQGLPIPQQYSKDVLEGARLKPEKMSTPLQDFVEKPAVEPATVGSEPQPTGEQVQQYDRISKGVDRIEWGLKKKSLETYRKIDDLQAK